MPYDFTVHPQSETCSSNKVTKDLTDLTTNGRREILASKNALDLSSPLTLSTVVRYVAVRPLSYLG